MIHVVIPVYNRLKYTIKCIQSLNKQVNFDDLNLIVVDDNSTDGTKDYLKKNFPKIKILSGNGSLYWGGAIFYGIEHVLKISSINDWALLVNNDVQFNIDSVLKLVKIGKINKRKALVGALTIDAKDRVTIIKSGTVVENWFFNKTTHIYEGVRLDKIYNKSPIQVDFLTARCLLHPVEIFKKVGNYDAMTFKHYGGDDEFSMRVKKYDYLTLLCPSSVVYLKRNEAIVSKNININNFFHALFNIKSSLNIFNKFKLTLKIVPWYAKPTFFLIGVMKSLYIFFKKK